MASANNLKLQKMLRNSEGFRPVTEEAVLLLLAETEQTLRHLITSTVRYSKKYKRAKMKGSDFVRVLEENNLKFLTKNRRKKIYKFVSDEENSKFRVKDDLIGIEESMEEIIKKRLEKTKNMKINMDWFLIKGEINNRLIVSGKEENTLKTLTFGLNKDKASIDDILPRTNPNTFLVKELTPNVVTRVG